MRRPAGQPLPRLPHQAHLPVKPPSRPRSALLLVMVGMMAVLAVVATGWYYIGGPGRTSVKQVFKNKKQPPAVAIAQNTDKDPKETVAKGPATPVRLPSPLSPEPPKMEPPPAKPTPPLLPPEPPKMEPPPAKPTPPAMPEKPKEPTLPVGPTPEPKPVLVSFEEHVLPIFETRCIMCHGEDKKFKGGLDLRTLAALMKGGDSGLSVVPGSPERSPLYESIANDTMPPGKLIKLTAAEKAIIRKWIASGAK